MSIPSDGSCHRQTSGFGYDPQESGLHSQPFTSDDGSSPQETACDVDPSEVVEEQKMRTGRQFDKAFRAEDPSDRYVLLAILVGLGLLSQKDAVDNLRMFMWLYFYHRRWFGETTADFIERHARHSRCDCFLHEGGRLLVAD